MLGIYGNKVIQILNDMLGAVGLMQILEELLASFVVLTSCPCDHCICLHRKSCQLRKFNYMEL